MKRREQGYTLAEVLIAATILAMAVAAAAVLALTMVAQEDMNARVSRLINLHEQAARLYQLGLDSDEIAAILPPDPGLISVSFPVATVTEPDLGTFQQSQSTMVFQVVPDAGWSEDVPAPAPQRTSSLTVVRPSIN